MDSKTTANKGEWAEIYIFLKLLADGELHTGITPDTRTRNSRVTVLDVIREETPGEIKVYSRGCEAHTIYLRINGELVGTFPVSSFKEQAEKILLQISSHKRGTIPITPDFYQFAKQARITSIKAPAVATHGNFGGKSDIILRILNNQSGIVSNVGFSIKSHYSSSPPTLYNTTPSGAFIFRILGPNDEEMERFNTIAFDGKPGLENAGEYFRQMGWQAEFFPQGMSPQTLDNFFMIRDSMANIFAHLMKYLFLECPERPRTFADLIPIIESKNPLSFRNTDVYEKAIKDLLFASFAGMTAKRPWNGREEVNGGYIALVSSGEVTCHPASDRERFRDYLFHATKLETTSRKKMKWGKMYREGEDYFLKLNPSIRFQ